MRRAGALLLGAGLLAFPVGADEDSDPAAAAAAWLASLDDARAERARYAFTDAERFDLRLAPFRLEGLTLGEMRPDQAAALRRLLATLLSPEGLEKVETIRSLEREVARAEREEGLTGRLRSWIVTRDPAAYYLAFFGEPAPGPWGLRFEGHHLSLHLTAAGAGAPASTPLFLGAQPREVRAGWERAGLRVLAAEEDLARALYTSLDPEQRERATLPFAADRELFVGGGRRLELEAPPRGIPRAGLEAAQRELLDALIEVYIANFAAPIATARREEIEAQRDAIHFAWAGGDAPGERCYYRIRGRSFVIEYDDTLEGADHVHALWRDAERDFGLDLLAEHHRRAHATAR